MPPASTLASGRDVHQESLAGAEVAHDHGAEVTDLGPIRTRPAAIDPRSRTRPSQAPALLPPQAGDGVHTERRDAGPLARLRRSGELTPVEVPAGDDDASRDLSRAGEAARGALQAAQRCLNACVRRHDRRDPGRATWGPAHRRGLRAVVGPPPAPPIVFPA